MKHKMNQGRIGLALGGQGINLRMSVHALFSGMAAGAINIYTNLI